MPEWVTCLLCIQKFQVSYVSLETCYPEVFSGFSQSLLANVGTFLRLIEKGVVNFNFSLTTPSFYITHMPTHTHTQNEHTEIQPTQEAYLTNYEGLMTYLWITLCSKTIFSQWNITKYYDFVLLVLHKFPVPSILQVWSSQAMQELNQDMKLTSRQEGGQWTQVHF